MMSPDTKLMLAQESRGSPPVDYVQRYIKSAPDVFSQNLHSKGFRRRCAPKHRNSRRETAGWDIIDRQEVFVLY